MENQENEMSVENKAYDADIVLNRAEATKTDVAGEIKSADNDRTPAGSTQSSVGYAVTYQAHTQQSARSPEEESLNARRAEIAQLQSDIEKEEVAQKTNKTTEKESKNSNKKVVSLSSCIIAIVIATVLGVVLTVTLLMYAPIPYSSDSMFGRMMTEYTKRLADNSGKVLTEPQDVVVEGNVIESGDNVEINVIETDEVAKAVYAKANKSVVGITVVSSMTNMPWYSSTYQTSGSGSGIVYSADGLIVTNYHVIEGALSNSGTLASGNEIRVYLDTSLAKYYTAELKGYDSTTDLALLKIDVTGLTPIEIADSESIEVGETVVAIGSPGGIEFMNSVSSGIVSGLNRNLSTESGIAYNLIQTTAAINPGNSGGALLNAEGELIGICVLKVAADNYEGMGFAISSNTVKTVVESISKDGNVKRPVLGITVNTQYNATEANANNLPVGAWVNDVTKDSAADKAGIKAGDIIVEIAGKEVQDFYDLRNELLKHGPGETISIKYYRDGTYSTANAVLDAE